MVRILVIEDEEPIRENIIETLELNDYDVVSAPNGLEGLKIAHASKPDVILCDIMMNGLDGYGVLDQVRRAEDISLTPFIFITAKTDRNSMRQGMDMGADDYLMKPFTTEELLQAVETRLSRIGAVEQKVSKEMDGVKKQLAHVISHELRTPLTSINMAIQLMSQQLDFLSAEQIHDLIDTLGNGTNRLNRLVEQMSLFVQARAGLMSVESIRRGSREEEVWTLVIAAMNRAHYFIYRENNVKVDFSEEFNDTRVVCFRDLIIHALAEIIANAIGFSGKQEQIRITQKPFSEGVRIRVRDFGLGMETDKIQLAMQDFTQVDRDRYEQQGMGIGLPLANYIFTAHGGKLEIKSVVGEGTQVDIYLPYRP